MNQLAIATGNWRARIKHHKKWIIGGVILLVVLSLVTASKFKAVQADKVEVKVTEVTSTVVEKGTVTSNNTGVFSEVQGTVEAIHVEEGQTVQKGQVLADIDLGDIDSRIAQLEGQLRAIEGSEQSAGYQNGQNQIKQQQLAVEQAEVALDLAQTDYDRMEKLFSQGAVTLAELEKTKADVDIKQKALEQANFLLKSIQGQSQGSKINFQGQRESVLARLQQLQTEKTKARILAETKNVVFVKKIKVGDYVTPGTMLFSLGQQESQEIETYVGSSETAYLKIGDKVVVEFKLPGQDLSVTGKISKIAPIAEKVVTALGISEPKIKINVALETLPDNFNVIPGADVDVTFTTQRHSNVVAIPKEALFSDKGKDYVWLVDNGTAVLKQIQKGSDGDELTIIKTGLAKGDLVLLNPHQEDLQPGIRIK